MVDPSEAEPVLRCVQDKGLSLRSILTTHHHWDHTGGNEAIAEAVPGVEVYCSSYDFNEGRVPRATKALEHGDSFELFGSRVACLSVPGHTLGAIAFHLPEHNAVFTGDTLFTAGCGRLFEGTPEQMHQSLQSLAALDPQTLIYCGHEYTEKNLQFAQSVMPDDDPIRDRLSKVAEQRAEGQPTVPAPLAMELSTNPFLRAVDPQVQARLGVDGPAAAFAELRQRRDQF